jgi:glycosyltransferase involved in cell wall biosynthesis
MIKRRRATAARRRANRARDQRHWHEAAASYRDYLTLVPDDVAILIQLGHMLSEALDFEGANAAYSAADAAMPGNADLLLCWGHSRKRAGDIAAARDFYSRSADLDRNADALRELEMLGVAVPHPVPSAASMPLDQVEFSVLKPLPPVRGEELALMIAHSPAGAIKPHVGALVAAYQANGVRVLLIVNADRPVSLTEPVFDDVDGLIVRRNKGYDFAAWAQTIERLPEVLGASILYLTNDSVIGSAQESVWSRLFERVRSSKADIVGLTEGREYRWHMQSYFLALKSNLLSSFALVEYFRNVRVLHDKDAIVRAYELTFSDQMVSSGFAAETLFPSHSAHNPVLFGWRELIKAGFPFVKVLLLRGAFAHADIDGAMRFLARWGFDAELVKRTLSSQGEDFPLIDDYRLTIGRPAQSEEPGPLKVAFFGPWNYDNGLGAASRGMIGALRHSGALLNLFPIEKPFHVHRPLTPPIPARSFTGPADIAVVHLNPDSWPLLTEAQRDEVRRAKRRIGYWVWEMGHIPLAWWHEFRSVDRIWAPSRYCADLFREQGDRPVDVIPHVVETSDGASFDRAAYLNQLGLAASRKIILYVFDGSSYLVRKNPAALVRAFQKSELGEKGWTLVLKTKHLMDRPEDGRRFRDQCAVTPNVLLMDRSLSKEELRNLMALADIYASPHCSEGFGLTIAEAMGAGKAVVATDFGGSRDFLNADNGYPVAYSRWTLEENFGHYTAGGEWARIDEDALSETLKKAALEVQGGGIGKGESARKDIAQNLSYEAVGKRIAESFAEVMGRTEGGLVNHIHVNLGRGIPIDVGNLSHAGFKAFPLRADGSADRLSPGSLSELGARPDQWLVIAPSGSVVSPNLTVEVEALAAHRPDIAIIYGDDVALEVDRTIDHLRVKPSFDLTLLAAQDYIGAPLIIRARTFLALDGLDPARGTAAISDLLFRAHERGLGIERLPRVLLGHPERRPEARLDDYLEMLKAQPLLKGFQVREGIAPGTTMLSRRAADIDVPHVTLLIPTCRSSLPGGKGTYIERLLDSLDQVNWPAGRLSVIVGDDVAAEPDWARGKRNFALRRIVTERPATEPFNYAAKMNRLWRLAESDHIVFVNDDVMPTSSDWLEALMVFARQQDVGGVGARLLFEDGRLQHAGIAPHGPAVAHTWLFRPAGDPTYRNWALVHREWSMVTGAVFATRRSLMEEVNGFDEIFTLEFNDIDLCLRLRSLGYRIVYTPHAEMIHAEKASRGERPPPGEDIARFLKRWGPWLQRDPSWHPWLRTDRLDVIPSMEDGAWYV